MYTEDQLIPISALQHLIFCPRQCALIHLEQAWQENFFTAEGRNMHEKVHESDVESRGDVRIMRGLRLQSLRFGLVGQADVVEFIRSDTGISVDQAEGLYQPYPVEYKRGKPKLDDSDTVQLCAQALCLEEMMQIDIPEGALFYGRPRRRHIVVLDYDLRARTEQVIDEVHILFADQVTPKADYIKKKCAACSLVQLCMPKVTGIRKDVAGYLAKARDVDYKT